MFGHHCFPASTSQTSEPVNTSRHSVPVTSTPEPMGKPCRRARLSAERPGEASTSQASSSSSQAEQLPCDHFQEQKQKLSKGRMLTKTQSRPAHTRVPRCSNCGANLPDKMINVACVSTSAAKTTRSPVLAKRVYTRNTGHNAVNVRQRRCNERLRKIGLKAARCRVFEGWEGNNQVSSSKSQTASMSQTSEPVNTSLHSAPVTNTPEPMGKSRRSAKLSAERPGKASTSQASSSSSQAEQLPCNHFQEQKEKLSKDRMLTKTQSQPPHTQVTGCSNCANLPDERSPVACVSTPVTKTTRSPVLAKRIYTRDTGYNAVNVRQRRRYERLGKIGLKAARCRVFQGQKGNNHVSSSKSQTVNSVNCNHTTGSPAAQVSISVDKTPRATVRYFADYKLEASDVAEIEARYMEFAIGNDKLLQEYKNWNLNWSCSLMTHDTQVLQTVWHH